MAFDLSTAKPVEDSGGFDLATAKPVASDPAPDPSAGGGTLQFGPWDTGIKTPEWLDRTLAGAGKAFVDLGRGAGQLVGAESRQDVADARELDKPLMDTTAGKVGNVLGNVAAVAPALAIPGAATAAGAGAIGAGLGLLQPSTSTEETLLNTGLGGALGATGQGVGNKVAGWAANKLADRAAAAQLEASLQSARDAILKDGRDAGYVINPTSVNHGAAATAAESISGKAATPQAAQEINAKVTNRLIREDLGLQKDQPITRQALKNLRDQAGGVYGQVEQAGPIASDGQYLQDLQGIKQMGPDLETAYPGIGANANEKVVALADSLNQPTVDAKHALGAYKFLNNAAKDNFSAGFAGDPQALQLARGQRAAADALSDLIHRNLTASGNQALADAWDNARTTIAKSYTAEGALKGNNIDANNLAAQMRKGKYLSGNFARVANFADQFPKVSAITQGGAGVSKLAAALGGGSALTAMALGHPGVAAVEAAATATPYAVRAGLMSKLGQRLLASPNYGPGMTGNAALGLSGLAAKYGTLPATEDILSDHPAAALEQQADAHAAGGAIAEPDYRSELNLMRHW